MIKLPVRQLVELMMRSGDIDNRFVSGNRMQEGARAHRAWQKTNRERYRDYRSEAFLSGSYFCDGQEYLLEGRADGVFSHNGAYIVEEIKTTALPIALDRREITTPPTGDRLNVMPISSEYRMICPR